MFVFCIDTRWNETKRKFYLIAACYTYSRTQESIWLKGFGFVVVNFSTSSYLEETYHFTFTTICRCNALQGAFHASRDILSTHICRSHMWNAKKAVEMTHPRFGKCCTGLYGKERASATEYKKFAAKQIPEHQTTRQQQRTQEQSHFVVLVCNCVPSRHICAQLNKRTNCMMARPESCNICENGVIMRPSTQIYVTQ